MELLSRVSLLTSLTTNYFLPQEISFKFYFILSVLFRKQRTTHSWRAFVPGVFLLDFLPILFLIIKAWSSWEEGSILWAHLLGPHSFLCKSLGCHKDYLSCLINILIGHISESLFRDNIILALQKKLLKVMQLAW